MLKRLVSAINEHFDQIFIHVDLKSMIDDVKFSFKQNKNVNFINNRVDVTWGHYSQLEMMLNSLKSVRDFEIDNNCIFYHTQFLSGLDYPLVKSNVYRSFMMLNRSFSFVSAKEIQEDDKLMERLNTYLFLERFHIMSGFLGKLVNRTLSNKYWNFFIYAHPIIKVSRYSKLKKNATSFRNTYFKGSQWMCLNYEAKSYILYLMDSKYFIDFKKTLCCDEIAIQSAICQNSKLFIKRHLTFVDWTRETVPYVFTKEDHHLLLTKVQEGYFFARKFRSEDSRELLSDLDNEYQLKISY